MPTGTVNWYKDSKGGYITPDNGGADIFFYRTGIVDYERLTVSVGMHVEYDVIQSRPGPEAIKIKAVATAK
ncbi:cold-shock protein [Pandoraea iniqua]|uniref:Cold-shock protein n=1 Tax=Pandoraea iniqua TaxID=2508288 RepID=A0A5E4Z8Q6_9BURK|nr:cold shock domain-containing protein [Pandoraea iniqua]VVE56765.1 cold-shock protein [Pandoraea iniqua]